MKTWSEMARDLAGRDIRQSLKYTCFAGLIAHGVALFNKLAWQNELDHGFGSPQDKAISLGRWLKAGLYTLGAKLFGGRNLSVPLLYGVVSLLLIALTAHVIIKLFDIENRALKMVLCGIMAVFPVVTTTFAYMYAAPYYFLALFLATLGVYFAAERPKWDGIIAAIVCIGCCLGLYQAYYPVTVSLFVICLFFEIARDRHSSFQKAFLRGLYFLGICVATMAFYFVVWKIVLKLTGLSLGSHQGMSSIGQSGIRAYLEAIVEAYRRFIPSGSLYRMSLGGVQWAVIVLSGICGICIVARHFRKDALEAVLMVLLLALLPLCFNLVYVMVSVTPSEEAHVYTLMLYGQCMLYVFLICALGFLRDVGEKLTAFLCRAGVVVIAALICLDVYFDNACYLKAQVMIQQTISDATVMISRIKSTEGYRDDMPVCFVKKGKRDATRTSNSAFSEYTISPYGKLYPYHNTHYYLNFMEVWCGVKLDEVSSKPFKNLEEVKNMPDYPDDGSVKIINDTVVIKW